MAITGNPLAIAREIGDGFHSLTTASLKRYTPADLKTINTSLQQVLRDARGETPPSGDAEAIRKKNLRLQRLNTAILTLTNYCRQQRIPV
ncbi:MAG: hypothetical protein ACREJK_01805 [Candidatus Methylomirabilales bacterium]